MNELIRKDALRIINDAIAILKHGVESDVIELKKLSNHTIHNASLFQDDCSISVAVLVYALSKIMEREGSDFKSATIIKLLEQVKISLETGKDSSLRHYIQKLLQEVSRRDTKLRLYVQEVISKAQIKKGCKLCQHGLTAAQASQVMGVSQWDIMNYLGKTNVSENAPITNIRNRLKFARSLFS